MVKYKTKSKDCQLIVKANFSSDMPVDENELMVFSRKCIRGFLKPQLIKSQCIEYKGPIGISLFERLKMPVTKYEFFFIIEQVIDATQKLQKNQFPWNKVVWDLKNTYINKTTKEMQFIYLPINGLVNASNIIEYLESIIYSAIPGDEHDSEFVSRFVYFLKDLPHYDPEKIEQFIIKEDRHVVNTIKKHNTGGSGFMTDKPKDYYAHYENKSNDSDDEDTGLLDEEETGKLDEETEETGLLNSNDSEMEYDDDATGLLVEGNVSYPIMHRTLTNEDISINKPVFRFGKEKSYVDYFVTNNNAVSRSHADVITRNNRYFIIDLNSKNKTFVNGQSIPVQTEIEIFDGNVIKLGNEEFVFNTNE